MKNRIQIRHNLPAIVISMAVPWLSSALGDTVTYSTAGTSNWVCPPGVTSIKVECWGGGGAGGGANNTATSGTVNVAGGGGAGGAYARKASVAVTPGLTYTVTIPAAATRAAGSAEAARTNGGTVTFTGNDGVVTAIGGEGGASKVASTSSTGASGVGSITGCVGDVVFAGGSCTVGTGTGTAGGGGGGAGDAAAGSNTSSNTGGAGGVSGGGAGGSGPTGSNAGGAGNSPGGGGSGGRMQQGNGTARAGGTGGLGKMVLTYTVPPNFKANNADNLNLTSSWTAGVPVSSPAIWQSTVTSANATSLGSDLTFSGIQVVDPGGLVTINSGNTLTLGAATTDIDLSSATQDLTLNCNLAMGAANVWDVASGRTLTLGGVVSGAFAVTKQGSGTAILQGANTYTGNTTVSAGTLKLAASAVIPDAAGNGNLALAGTLDLNGNNETINGLSGAGIVDNTAASTASTLTVGANAQTSSFSGTLQNSGASASLGLTKTGNGTLTLTGASTHTGLTTVNGGALNIQNASALGATTAGTEVNGTGTGATSNARIDLQGGVTVSGEAITIKGVGNFIGALSSFSGVNEWAGNVTVGATGTRIGASAGATLNISGVIDSGVTTTGLAIRTTDLTGVVILSGANTYLGDTSFVVGKLQLGGGDNRLPVATKLLFTGANTANTTEFDLNGRNQEVAGISLSGAGTAAFNSVNNSSGTLSTLTVNTASSPSSFASILKGNLAVTKTGVETLTLAGANTYSGATNVNTGTLLFSTAGTGASDVSVSASASAGALVAATDGQFISTGSLALNNSSILTIDYGTTTPSTTVAPVKVSNFTAGSGLSLFFKSTNLAGLTVSQTYPLVTWTTSGPADGTAFTTVINPRIHGTFSVSGSTLSFTVTANAAGSPVSWNTGNGTWDTSTSNWVDGNLATTTYFDTFDAVRFGDAIGANGNPIVTLNTAVSPAAVTMNSATHDYTLTGTGSIGGNTSLTLDAANTHILTLANANTYTGATSINGGTLRLGNGGADGSIATTGPISIGTGATFAVDQSDTVTQGTDFSTSAISGAGGIAQTGSGTTILNANNTYTGPTTISGGTLQIGGAGKLGGGTYAGDIAISGGTSLQYASSAAQTFSGILSGSGSLTSSSGALTLSGANIHTGTTTVGGTLILSNVAALSTTTGLTLGDGSILRPSLGGVTINAPVTLGAAATNATIEAPNINPGNQSPVVLSLNGAITGSGDITFSSTPDSNTINTVLLNAQNNYSGGTLITRSAISTTSTQTIVKLGVNNALPVTTVVTIDGGDGAGTGRCTEINLNGFSQQLAGLTNVLRPNVTNSIRRQRIVNSDVAAHAILTINNTADYTYTGYLGGTAFSVSASAIAGSSNGDNFSLVKSGTGKFTLATSSGAGGLSYKGNTTVNTGTLSLGWINAGNELSTVSVASGATLELTYSGTDTVDKLFIGGNQLAAGQYGATGSVLPIIGVAQITGTGTLTVTSGPSAGGYASWKTANGTSQTIDLDHDGDGVSNGVEYFLGGTANTTGFTALPGVTNTAGTLSITWTKAAGYTGAYSTDFVVETSSTLTGVWATETLGVNVTVIGNDVKYTFPAGTRNFARLKVTGP